MKTKEDDIDLFSLENITLKIKLIPFQFIVSEWVVCCERKRGYAIIFTIWLHLFSKNYHFFFKKWRDF